MFLRGDDDNVPIDGFCGFQCRNSHGMMTMTTLMILSMSSSTRMGAESIQNELTDDIIVVVVLCERALRYNFSLN